jgi:hypothetical protein
MSVLSNELVDHRCGLGGCIAEPTFETLYSELVGSAGKPLVWR